MMSFSKNEVPLNMKELFEFIKENINGLDDLEQVFGQINQIIIFESSSTIYVAMQKNFKDMFHKYQENENHMEVTLKILHYILKSLKSDTVDLIRNLPVLLEVIELFYNSDLRNIRIFCLSCLRIAITKFSETEILAELWRSITQTHKLQLTKNTEILVHLIDEFLQWNNELYENEHFITIVQNLLKSKSRENRISGIYLLKRCLSAMESLSPGNYKYWLIYGTIIENLEEKQTHLILPSLDQIVNIKLEQSWLDILFIQILSHDNIFVIRWGIEFLLTNRNASDLTDEVLQQFFSASNRTNLFNYEEYFLPCQGLAGFLKNNFSRILKFFVNINWKSVPLHFWLAELQKIDRIEHILQRIENELFLNLSAKIRCIQNTFIRKDLQKIFEIIFDLKIDCISLKDYLTYIETMYNKNFYSYSKVIEKIEKCTNIPKQLKITQKLYLILTRNNVFVNKMRFEMCLLDAYDNIPMEAHGYFRLMAIFDFNRTEKLIEFCKKHYNIEIDEEFSTLNQAQAKYNNLVMPNKTEDIILREKIVDAFVSSLKNIKQLENLDVSIENLLDAGGVKTLYKLSQLLINSRSNINTNITTLNRLLVELQRHIKNEYYLEKLISNILIYAGEHRDDIAQKIIKLNDQNLTVCTFVLNNASFTDDAILDGIFSGCPTAGDQRIEQYYCFRKGFGNALSSEIIRSQYRNYIWRSHKKMGVEYTRRIYYKLLDRIDQLAKNNCRYFENSMLHRLKLRAVVTIAKICSYFGEFLYDERLWIPVLNENNQVNVTHLYERIIAMTIKDRDDMLKHLQTMTSHSNSKQVSIMTVAFMFSYLKNDTEFAKTLINTLLPATMGACYNVRLHAQLIIYYLITHYKFSESIFSTIRNAICETLGDQLTKFLQDIRFDFKKDTFLRTDIILFITNAPFDEYVFDLTESELKPNHQRKMLFAKKNCEQENSIGMPSSMSNMQRKNNPLTLSLCQEKIQSQNVSKSMIVVASLIDNLANVGGIARTCEVLGIKKLILNSLNHIKSADFQNLSMTAEKYLDISEAKRASLSDFLLQKRSEGFEIVGAEQTAYSQNFVNFKFPKKCVLLLGHEKEGIPPPLLSLLDSAVEIPQSGLVRSLNVHVTGALFMWEYCKQHFF